MLADASIEAFIILRDEGRWLHPSNQIMHVPKSLVGSVRRVDCAQVRVRHFWVQTAEPTAVETCDDQLDKFDDRNIACHRRRHGFPPNPLRLGKIGCILENTCILPKCLFHETLAARGLIACPKKVKLDGASPIGSLKQLTFRASEIEANSVAACI